MDNHRLVGHYACCPNCQAAILIPPASIKEDAANAIAITRIYEIQIVFGPEARIVYEALRSKWEPDIFETFICATSIDELTYLLRDRHDQIWFVLYCDKLPSAEEQQKAAAEMFLSDFRENIRGNISIGYRKDGLLTFSFATHFLNANQVLKLCVALQNTVSEVLGKNKKDVKPAHKTALKSTEV